MMNTVDYKELMRAREEANEELRKLHCELFNEDSWRSAAVLSEAPMWGKEDETVKMQINWSAIGAVDVDKAQAMATLLQKAVELATNFIYNGYTVTY